MFMRRLAPILVLVCAFGGAAGAQTTSTATGAAWSAPSGYRYVASPGCEDADGGSKYRKPIRAAYEVCADQMKLFMSALDEARKQGKLLLVEFGGTWCGWCGTLQKQLPGPELLGWTGQPLDMTKAFHRVEIGISTLYRGEREDIPSGHSVVSLVHARIPGARLRSLPYLAVIDPNNPQRVFARNIGDVPLVEKRFYDPTVLRSLLGGAHDYLLKDGPAPTEPGWLKRQMLKVDKLIRG